MRKKLIAIMLALFLIPGVSSTAYATGEAIYFNDDAGIVSAEDVNEINSRLADISKQQKCGVYLLTTDNFNGQSPQTFADDFYDENELGYGSNHSGILLAVNFDSGDWVISTAGSGISVFTDAGQEYLMDRVTADLRDNPAAAFSVYADQCENFLVQAADGEAYDNGNMPRDFNLIIDIAIGIIIGVVIAFIVVGRQKAALRTVRRQTAARDYMKSGSLKMTASSEQFLYNTVDHIEKQSNSGGSSTHQSSSGMNHGGSSGKF